MSDIQDVFSPGAAQLAPASSFISGGVPFATNDNGTQLASNDVLNGTSGADRTALSNYLATQGNVHANSTPLSDNDAAMSLAQLMDQDKNPANAVDEGLFSDHPGAIPNSVYDQTLYSQAPQATSAMRNWSIPTSTQDQIRSTLLAQAGATPEQVAQLGLGPTSSNASSAGQANNAEYVPANYLSQTYMQPNYSQPAVSTASRGYQESAATADETKAEIHSMALRVNSDGTVEGKANDVDVAQNLKADHANLLDANKDIPGGFQIGNQLSADGSNTKYTAKIDGADVVVDQNGDGPMKVTVNGKEVKPGERSGPVNFEKGGPGGCGILHLTGEDKATGAKIDAAITKDIVFDKLSFGRMHQEHKGLTLQIDDLKGPNGLPLNVGGALGEALTQ